MLKLTRALFHLCRPNNRMADVMCEHGVGICVVSATIFILNLDIRLQCMVNMQGIVSTMPTKQQKSWMLVSELCQGQYIRICQDPSKLDQQYFLVVVVTSEDAEGDMSSSVS